MEEQLKFSLWPGASSCCFVSRLWFWGTRAEAGWRNSGLDTAVCCPWGQQNYWHLDEPDAIRSAPSAGIAAFARRVGSSLALVLCWYGQSSCSFIRTLFSLLLQWSTVISTAVCAVWLAPSSFCARLSSLRVLEAVQGGVRIYREGTVERNISKFSYHVLSLVSKRFELGQRHDILQDGRAVEDFWWLYLLGLSTLQKHILSLGSV